MGWGVGVGSEVEGGGAAACRWRCARRRCRCSSSRRRRAPLIQPVVAWFPSCCGFDAVVRTLEFLLLTLCVLPLLSVLFVCL